MKYVKVVILLITLLVLFGFTGFIVYSYFPSVYNNVNTLDKKLEYNSESFSVKVPSSWRIDESSNPLGANEEYEYLFIVTSEDTTLEDGKDSSDGIAHVTIMVDDVNSDLWDGFGFITGDKDILVDGYSAKQKSSEYGMGGGVFDRITNFEANGKRYYIAMSTQDVEHKETFIREYNQILSQFKIK